ncbi:MAG: hypothetical protein WBO70_07970, partial [Erysipelotrichaceae bacterium]
LKVNDIDTINLLFDLYEVEKNITYDEFLQVKQKNNDKYEKIIEELNTKIESNETQITNLDKQLSNLKDKNDKLEKLVDELKNDNKAIKSKGYNCLLDLAIKNTSTTDICKSIEKYRQQYAINEKDKIKDVLGLLMKQNNSTKGKELLELLLAEYVFASYLLGE